MNLSRKDFLRLTSASTASSALGALVSSCGGGDSSSTSSPPSTVGLWSNPATWGGTVPSAIDAVTIGANQTIVLDTDAVCSSLTIVGTLNAQLTRNVSITTGFINISASGQLIIGTESDPYPAAYTATITLNGAETSRSPRTVNGINLGFTNSGQGRSLQVQPGGVLSLIGVPPKHVRTKLNDHATSGAKSFIVADDTGWKIGDEIVIGSTDFYGIAEAQKLTLSTSAANKQLTTTNGIVGDRWGKLQYVTDLGMSLTKGAITNPPVNTATELDERAFVINLTRNIVVQGADDLTWRTGKFGLHMMFMGRESNIKIDGVQFRRCGQAGAIGRYPIHWHMMSYRMRNGMDKNSDGTFIGAVLNNHYVKNCSVSESSQRMVVLHGTHGVKVDSNVGFDITGHAIFLEDGSEQDNTISNNVVMKVRAPASGNKLYLHDVAASDVGSGTTTLGLTGISGTAGIWFSNPKNTLTGNWVNDAEGNGVWNTFATRCFGLSSAVALVPRDIDPFNWSDNWAYGCKSIGIKTNDIMVNDQGDLTQDAYRGATDDWRTSPIDRVRSFKNSAGGYSNRIRRGKYTNFILADNAGMDVFGQSQYDGSLAVNVLSVAESLNNQNSKKVTSYRAAFATYHELLNFQNGIFVDYKYAAGVQQYSQDPFVGGGLFRMWDLYTAPLFTFSLNTGNKLIGCEVPFRSLPPHKDGAPYLGSVADGYTGANGARHWTLAGAIKDVNGLFTTAGNYWVYTDPFLTYNATRPINISPSIPSNGVITIDRYFGVGGFLHSDDLNLFAFQLPINITRLDGGISRGIWNVPDGATSSILPNMRHFAAHNGGRFKIDIPNSDSNNTTGAGRYGGVAHPASACDYFEFTVSNQHELSDAIVVGVPFGGGFVPRVYQRARYVPRLANNKINVPSLPEAAYDRLLNSIGVSSITNVEADTTGTKYWHDTVNHVVWIKIKVADIINAEPPGNWGNASLKTAITVITV